MSRHWNRHDFIPAKRRSRWTAGEVRIAVLGGVFLGLAIASAPSAVAPPAGVMGFAAVHVVDGDTFDQGGVRIRVADIDTPEMEGRCPSETRRAARAKARMRELLQAGPFELHPIAGRDTDRYGRKLRIVTRNGHSLGDQLVAEGLARTWSGRREPWC